MDYLSFAQDKRRSVHPVKRPQLLPPLGILENCPACTPSTKRACIYAWGGQPPLTPILDCALEVLLAALGQLCRRSQAGL